MLAMIPTGIVALFALLLQASAQLLSCTDINCPHSSGLAKCKIDNTILTMIGVANLSSSLSPNPLTWTTGFAPEYFTNASAQRRYYLGTPQELKLNSRTDITGCALFFDSVQGLSFVIPNGTLFDMAAMSGTCADALGSACVGNVTSQALNLVANGPLNCSDLAKKLQSSPPLSCTKAGTWGNIIAKRITGPDTPTPLQLNECHPTLNGTYDVRSIAMVPNLGAPSFSINITPLMTIFAPNGNATTALTAPEVHMNCIKPMEDFPPGQTFANGDSEAFIVWNSFSSMVVALLGFMLTMILLA